MLFYGTVQTAWIFEDNEKAVVFNFNSYSEKYQKLNLTPQVFIGSTNTMEFDQNYYQLIMSTDAYFMELMKIIMMLYAGIDVYICIGPGDYELAITESLLKLIQQRYGYNAVYVTCFEDVFTATDQYFDPGLIANLDMDRERFSRLYESMRIKNGGHPYDENFPGSEDQLHDRRSIYPGIY